MALHDIASRLAEACAGNPSTFRFHDVLVIVMPLPPDTGFDPAVLEAQPTAPASPPAPAKAATPAKTATPAKADPPAAPAAPPVTANDVRALARQAAAKHGAETVRAKLGKGVGEMNAAELTAAATTLRGMLGGAS